MIGQILTLELQLWVSRLGKVNLKKQEEINNVQERNRICAFAGEMRSFLIKMLDDREGLGVNKFLGINSCSSLWEENFSIALHTSILPYSVVRLNGDIPNKVIHPKEVEKYEIQYKKTHNNKNDGFFISKISYPTIKNNSHLSSTFDIFLQRLNECKKLELVIVLGEAFKIVQEAIAKKELSLDPKIVINIPHAAKSNIGKINGFLDAAKGMLPTNDMAKQKINGYKMYCEAKTKLKLLK